MSLKIMSLKFVIYVNVPFAQKDEAKRLGARWAPNMKLWYFVVLWDDFYEFIDDIRVSHTYQFKPVKASADIWDQIFEDVDYGDIVEEEKPSDDELAYVILKNNEKVLQLAQTKYAKYMAENK